MFDLATDSLEINNLAKDSAYQEVKERLQAKLLRLRKYDQVPEKDMGNMAN